MKTLVIKDSEWLRGTGKGVLYDPGTERMCCLGVHAAACGIDKEDISGIGLPYDLGTYNDFPEEYMYWLDNPLEADAAASINDDPAMTDEERIEQLRDLFTSAGWKIEFRPDE